MKELEMKTLKERAKEAVNYFQNFGEQTVSGLQMAELLSEIANEPEPEPVLVVEVEPGYWSRGSYYEGLKPHINPMKVWKLPIGTRLYTSPPAPAVRETWSAEQCAQVLATLRYIQGIAERGEGRPMREDETLEQFLLGYVKRLEAPAVQPDQSEQHLEMVNTPAPSVPDVCDGKEQDAFIAWANVESYDMSCHPLHFLFLNEKTNAARQGWKAAIRYCRAMLAAAPTPAEATCNCTFAQRMQGDGCAVCNPERAADLSNEAPADVARDAELLDWLEQEAKESRTGVSIVYKNQADDEGWIERGYRLMRYNQIFSSHPDLRAAIDAAMAAEKGGA